jgi:hypothetical protein
MRTGDLFLSIIDLASDMKETGESIHRLGTHSICTKLHNVCQVCLITESEAECHSPSTRRIG